MTNASTLADFGWSSFFATQLDIDDFSTLLPVRVMAVHRDRLHVAGPSFDGHMQPFVADPGDGETAATVGDWLLIDAPRSAAPPAEPAEPVQAAGRGHGRAGAAHRRQCRHAVRRHLVQPGLQRRAARTLSGAGPRGGGDAGGRADQGRPGRRRGRFHAAARG